MFSTERYIAERRKAQGKQEKEMAYKSKMKAWMTERKDGDAGEEESPEERVKTRYESTPSRRMALLNAIELFPGENLKKSNSNF